MSSFCSHIPRKQLCAVLNEMKAENHTHAHTHSHYRPGTSETFMQVCAGLNVCDSWHISEELFCNVESLVNSDCVPDKLISQQPSLVGVLRGQKCLRRLNQSMTLSFRVLLGWLLHFLRLLHRKWCRVHFLQQHSTEDQVVSINCNMYTEN